MGAVSLWLEVCELNPSINKPGVLARGEVLPWPTSAREKLVVRTMPTSGEPVLQRLPCGLGDLKGNGLRWRRKFGQLAKVGSTSMKDGLYDWEAEAVHG